MSLEANFQFSFSFAWLLTETEISPEMGSQWKDYHGTYTLYEDEVIEDETWKVIPEALP